MILSTKLHIPYVRSVLVQRPALVHNMNEGLKAKLTIISAPAGYGKTTLIGEWVKQCNERVAWVSLDQHDNDYARFWDYVIAAVAKACPDREEQLSIIRGTHRASLHEVSAHDPLITMLINELNTLNQELIVVLDDFHVIEMTSIHVSIMYLLEHLPSHIHLFIASRSELPIPTARLRAKGQLHKMIAQDLRFHLDEGVQFFQHCMGLMLSRDEVAQLVFYTEGWICGLHMAALMMKRIPSPAAFIHAFNGNHREIANYLFEEVFQQQTEQVRSFMLETSILSRMNSALCEAITAQVGCQQRLEELDKQNLWIIPLDEQRNWYRYHHLFSDFLQRHFRQHDLIRFKQVHQCAGRWLENNGFSEEAVDHYLESHDFTDAVRLIEKLMPALMQAQWTILHRWLAALPEGYRTEKPVIDILYIGILLGNGKTELAEACVQQTQARLQETYQAGSITEAEWKQQKGTLYLFGAIGAFTQQDLVRTMEYLEKFEAYLPEGSYFQMLGGNNSQGPEYGDLLHYMNDLRAADSFLQHWIKIWSHKKNYPFIGYFYVSYSELMYEWNRLDEAGFYAEQVLVRKDIQPFATIIVQAVLIASKVQLAKGNKERAFEVLEKVKQKVNSLDNPMFMMKIEAQQIYISLLQSREKQAIEWMEACGLKYTDSVPLHRISEYIHFARMLLESNQLAEAEHLLEDLDRIICNEDSLRDKIRVSVLQSMLFYRKGSMQNALIKLAGALHLAEPYGYVRSFVDEGEDMGELLSRYLHLRQNSFIRESVLVPLLYVKKLLLVLNSNMKDRLFLSSILTTQEEKILRLVEKGLTNKQIAEHNNVTVGTVKSHIKNMYRKLEVNSRLQALQRGKELDLL